MKHIRSVCGATQFQLGNRNPIVEDFSFLRFVKPQKEVQEVRLSDAAWAHYGYPFTGADVEGNVT